MAEPTPDTVTQRLDRVEREVRWYRFLGVVALVVTAYISLVGASGAKVFDEVSANRFFLVDSQGRRQGFLTITPNGSPVFGLYDSGGKAGIQLAVTDGAPSLSLTDKYERGRAVLAVLPDGSPGLDLLDKKGTLRAVLGVSADGKPALVLFAEDGTRRIGLTVGPEGHALVGVLDKDGKVIWKAP